MYFENNVPMLSMNVSMPLVPSHCLTNTLTNKDGQSLNLILHYFIGKTAFFQIKILQFGPLKTVAIHYLPNVRLIACQVIAQNRASLWIVSGIREFRININQHQGIFCGDPPCPYIRFAPPDSDIFFLLIYETGQVDQFGSLFRALATCPELPACKQAKLALRKSMVIESMQGFMQD